MNTLLIYYSRTGTTRKVAEAIKKELNCQSEEIESVRDRKGAFGYIISGKEASQKKPAEIKEIKTDAEQFDCVIIGTPIWAWNVSSPVRAYLEANKGKFKKVAFFCTQGGSGDAKAFAEMEKICGLKPEATLAFLTKEALGNIDEKVGGFCQNFK